jgi:type IV pilus assembly protein PilW
MSPGLHKCPNRIRCERKRAARQSGLTLVELMIALTLGLVVVMSASLLLLSSKSAYQIQDESTRLHETGRYALELIALAVHQAGYQPWESGGVANASTSSAKILGLDGYSLKSNSEGIDGALPGSFNGSDVLALRFIGLGKENIADGTVLNCAGFAVPEQHALEPDRGWSIFYVAMDAEGEPELRCKYRGKTAWNSEAVARGVESFQVLYGVDTDMDGMPDRFMMAQEIDRLDQALVLEGANAVERMLDKNRKTAWKRIHAVQASLLVRSGASVRSGDQTQRFDLFGQSYADDFSDVDRGSSIIEAAMPSPERGRMRKVFRTTVYVRNTEGQGPR